MSCKMFIDVPVFKRLQFGMFLVLCHLFNFPFFPVAGVSQKDIAFRFVFRPAIQAETCKQSIHLAVILYVSVRYHAALTMKPGAYKSMHRILTLERDLAVRFMSSTPACVKISSICKQIEDLY